VDAKTTSNKLKHKLNKLKHKAQQTTQTVKSAVTKIVEKYYNKK
jgi:hypothetical protein